MHRLYEGCAFGAHRPDRILNFTAQEYDSSPSGTAAEAIARSTADALNQPAAVSARADRALEDIARDLYVDHGESWAKGLALPGTSSLARGIHSAYKPPKVCALFPAVDEGARLARSSAAGTVAFAEFGAVAVPPQLAGILKAF